MALRSSDLARRIARDPAIGRIRAVARASGTGLHLVGGYLRDALLGRPLRDTDFILSGPSRPFLDELARSLGRRIVRFHKRGLTNHLLAWRGRRFDFVERGRRSLARELGRRDFTCNAVALDLETGQVLDPLGGRKDLRRGLLRATGPRIFRDDPLRLLRAVRLAAEIPELRIERATRRLIGREAPRVRRSAPERVRDELDRAFGSRRAGWALETLDRAGLLSPWLPEIDPLRGLEQNRCHHLDAWTHTVEAFRAADRPGLLGRGVLPAGLLGEEEQRDLRWALLLHDLGKADTRSRDERGEWRFFNHHLASERRAAGILRRLRFSRRRSRRVRCLVREHLRIALPPGGTLSPRARRRIVRDLDTNLPLLILQSLADQRASRGAGHTRTRRALRAACRGLYREWEDEAERRAALPPLIDGHALMAATGLEPGPRVGHLLERIRRHQLQGAVVTREEALDLARRAVRE